MPDRREMNEEEAGPSIRVSRVGMAWVKGHPVGLWAGNMGSG